MGRQSQDHVRLLTILHEKPHKKDVYRRRYQLLSYTLTSSFFCFSSGTCSAEIWLSVNTDRRRIFMDGTNPSFIRALKDRVDEDTNY